MKRRLANLAAAASLVLCVGTVALWVRSYWAGDFVEFGTVHGLRLSSLYLASSRGLLSFGGNRWEYQDNALGRSLMSREGIHLGLRHRAQEAEDWWVPEIGRFHAEYWGWTENSRAFASAYVVFPHWLPSLLSAALPGVWVVARLRCRHAAGQHCPTCGYDLRATPDRCPECGNGPSAR